MQPYFILHFWFEKLTAKHHFVKDAALDAGALCELFAWRHGPGRLAEIIVLDQFSRNVYRDTPRLCARRAGARG